MDDIKGLLNLSRYTKYLWPGISSCKRTVAYLLRVVEDYRNQFVNGDPAKTYESLDLVNERLEDLISYMKSVDERIHIQIDLTYNYSSRQDSKVNVDIARLTSKIAVAAQQDSSAMITFVCHFLEPVDII